MASSREKSLQALWESSPLAGSNAAYVEQLYEDYLDDPNSVPEKWRRFFAELPKVNGHEVEISHASVRKQFRDMAQHKPVSAPGAGAGVEYVHKQVRVLQLINAYRFRGHQKAILDPLQLHDHPELPELHLSFHELTDADLNTEFETGSLAIETRKAKLKDILIILNATYCSSIGAEYMHLTSTIEKRWLQNYLEKVQGKPAFSPEEKRKILQQLSASEGMERYLHTRYVGQKRFSLEGGESLIIMLKTLIERGGEQGVEEVAIGMAHRGRLNVLVNIMGKTPAELFREFEGGVA